MKITTNNQPRDLVSFHDLPEMLGLILTTLKHTRATIYAYSNIVAHGMT